MREDLPYPKQRLRLPVVLSPDEVQRLIASAKNLYHRTLLLTLYGAGLRLSEVCQLKVRDIDSQRMVLRVEQGKGAAIAKSPSVRRSSPRWCPSTAGCGSGRISSRGRTMGGVPMPITTKVIWEAVRLAARTAGIEKRVTPHMLRHSSRDPSAGSRSDLRTIQLLTRPRRPVAHDSLSPPLATTPPRGAHSARAAARRRAGRCAAVPTSAETSAIVSRPAVEVADVLHAQGEHFVDHIHGSACSSGPCSAR